MKTLQIIQKVLMAAGFVTGLSLMDGLETSYKDMWTGIIIIALIMVQLVMEQLSRELHKKD